MSLTAFIFARGGSKGLPNKNLLNLSGKPLLGWSIEAAKAANRVDRVIVSTDSLEIAKVALDFGAEVPFMRPKELALDDTPEVFAWRHAINFLHQSEGYFPEAFVSVPPTAPLRLPSDIDNCVELYFNNDIDAVITVSESHRSPFFNMVKIKSDGGVELVVPPDKKIFRRQDAPKTYDMTTVCYVLRTSFVMNKFSIFEGRIRTVQIPAERAIDIDDMVDFRFAEFMQS